MRSFLIMFLVLFFASCASISEKDCGDDKNCSNYERTWPMDYIGGRNR
jgi:hypothetical protein